MNSAFVVAIQLFQTQPGPPQWFDKETLFTAAGSTAAVIAVTTVLQRFSPKFPARWFALILSLALALLSIPVHQQAWSLVNILIALLNGVMTYSAAVGINTVATPTPGVAHHAYRWWP
jgi:predicted membrane channel-forming protein YqfA (hemolysin III family)